MAHTAVHFAVGLATGMALALPAVVRAWRRRNPPPADGALSPAALAPLLARLVTGSWLIGCYAVLPNLLRAAGLPEGFCGGWWMNVFLLHPLIDRGISGGTLVAGVLLVGALAGQYALIVLAIARRRSGGRPERNVQLSRDPSPVHR